MPSRDMREAARELTAWFRRHGRDLPWRHDRSAYSVWVSEVMLQQTRVDTVAPRYVEWMRRFPDVDSLAAASIDDVLAAWAGLGYYRRARLLHRGAQMLVERGELPQTASAWREVPSVGDYTAGAIAAQVHGEVSAVVDGNIERVIARLLAVTTDVRSAEGRSVVRAASREMLSAGAAGEVLEAMMDLGATVCTPRATACEQCPWRGRCAALRGDLITECPRLPARRASQIVHRIHLAIEHGDGWLLRRARPDEYGEGLWVFPASGFLEEAGEITDARALARSEGLKRVPRLEYLGEFRHQITHHRIRSRVFVGARRSEPPAGLSAISADGLLALGLPASDSRIARMLARRKVRRT